MQETSQSHGLILNALNNKNEMEQTLLRMEKSLDDVSVEIVLHLVKNFAFCAAFRKGEKIFRKGKQIIRLHHQSHTFTFPAVKKYCILILMLSHCKSETKILKTASSPLAE